MKSKKHASSHYQIGIDLLGCDTSPPDLIRGILEYPKKHEMAFHFTFFGTEEIFHDVPLPGHVTPHLVTETIELDDDPLSAIRHKKDSSINVGIEALKEGQIDAFISAGNTGALLTASTLKLNTLPHIDRPALLTLIPTKNEPVATLDVGANVNIVAENLLQFAHMGIAYQKARGIKNPKVGLLNIGEEKRKGTLEHRRAYELLSKLNDNQTAPIFIGNIEGRDVFRGEIDVLITDGFTGNVFLKTAEGIAGFIIDQMQNLGPIASLPGLKSIVSTLHQRLHYAEHPGAILCGIDQIVMKCHGASSPEAFINSIKGAIRLIKNNFIASLTSSLAQ